MFITPNNHFEKIIDVFAKKAKPVNHFTFKPAKPINESKLDLLKNTEIVHAGEGFLTKPEIKIQQEVLNAQSAIENYAKSKGVFIDIEEEIMFTDSNKALNTLTINVSNPKNDKVIARSIPVHADGTYEYTVNKKQLIPNLADGTERIVDIPSTYEDSFTRNLYRNIEKLTNMVINK